MNGRRAGDMKDYRDIIRLGQSFNVIDFFGNQAIAPTDLPANTRHLDTALANLTLADEVFFATGIGGGRSRDAVEMRAIAKGLSLGEMVDRPTVLTNINVNSPYHAAGRLEGGLVASFEKIVVDCEMLQHMCRLLAPLEITREEIGIEAMREVGPGGHFFGVGHTVERFRDAFHEPFPSDWRNHENRRLAGAKTATERATAVWQRVLAEYEAPAVDPGTVEALECFAAHRREVLGREEPMLEPLGA